MNDATIARIRTAVASAAGAAITIALNWLARHGLDVELDPNVITIPLGAAVAGGCAAAYTALVNALAKRWPILGRGLGVNRTPIYVGSGDAVGVYRAPPPR